MPAVGELIADGTILQWHAAEQLEFLEQLDGPEYRRTADIRQLCQEILDGEGAFDFLDRVEDSTPWCGGTEPDVFEPCTCGGRKAHAVMVAKAITGTPERALVLR